MFSAHANGGPMKTGDAALLVTDTFYKNGFLEVAYRFENKTKHDVWLCTNTDWKKLVFESVILKVEKKALLKIRSFVVPKDVFLEEPIFATYHRVLPGKSADFKIKVEVPIYDQSPLKSNKNNVLKLNDTDVIKLELGYFDQDLSSNSECCSKTKTSDELLVSCFWAETNGEKTISVEVKNKWKNGQ